MRRAMAYKAQTVDRGRYDVVFTERTVYATGW
jgi:hypothetical protein